MAAGRNEFADNWPALSARLKRALESRGVPSGLIDDIVQETGLRLLRKWDDVDQKTLWALALTIAGNIIKDEMRKSVRRDKFLATHSEHGVVDIEERAIARVELGRVKKALSALTLNQRLVLMAEIGHAGASINRGAMKMTRMRARQRLRSVLERASAGVALLGSRLRRMLSNDPPGWLVEQMPQAVAAALIVAVGAELAFVGGIAHDVPSREAQRPGASQTAMGAIGSDPTREHEGTSITQDVLYRSTSVGFQPNGGSKSDDGAVIDRGGEIGPEGTKQWVTGTVLGNSTTASVSAHHDKSGCEEDPLYRGMETSPGACTGTVVVEAEVVVNGRRFTARVSTRKSPHVTGADGTL